MMKKYELLKDLKQGQKITIVSSNDMGFVYVIQTVYHERKPHHHYVDCPESMIGVTIVHKPKRKRSLYKTVIDYNAQMLIYDGWIDVDTDCIYEIEEKDGMTVKKSKYTAFDNRNFEEIKNHYSEGIIIEDIDY
jgi:hypothetical protein